MEEEEKLRLEEIDELEPDIGKVQTEVEEIMTGAKELQDRENEISNAPKPGNNAKKTVLIYLHDIVYLLAVVLILFLLFVRVVVVSGPSMNNTLVNGDYLLLLNGVFFNEYKPGDVIVASKDTFHEGEPFVKRVIATEGQTVDIDFVTGTVTVDGVVLSEPYISTPTNLYEGIKFPQVVEPGHIFVMGDNRNNSKDSRSTEIGQVDCREVLGKAIFLLIPGEGDNGQDFGRIGVID